MVYELLSEYKEIFSIKNNYLRYFHKWKFVLIFIIMLTVWAVMYGVRDYYFVTIPYHIIPLPILFLLAMFILEIKRVVKEVHKMNSVKDYNKKLKAEFIDRLSMNKIDVSNKEQMDMLIMVVDKEVNELKPNFFLNKGIVAGLFAPLWINYVSSIFTNEVRNVQDATYVLMFFSTILLMILIIGFQVKEFLYNEIINSNYENLKRMSNLLEDAYLVSLNTNINSISNL